VYVCLMSPSTVASYCLLPDLCMSCTVTVINHHNHRWWHVSKR
jgi:hypothetical protein